MRTLVVGAGAIGGLVGGRLTQQGRDVTFLVRPRRARQLAEDSLRIVANEQTDVIKVNAVTVKDLAHPYDLVLIAVKAPALPDVMTEMTNAVDQNTAILPFLNGVSHVDRLVERFHGGVLGGTIRAVVKVGAAGDVVALAPTVSMEVGELDGSASPRCHQIASELDVAGFCVAVRTDIVQAMWDKWMYIASMGAVTGLMRATIGDIVAVTGGARFVESVLAEATAVAAAAGHPLADHLRASLHDQLTAAGSNGSSSLSRDAADGRPTEVEAVLGDLVARARKLGVAVPSFELATLALRIHDRGLDAS